MRRMVSVLIVMAFVAGGAFAQQASVGGGVIVGMDLARGDNLDDTDVFTAGTQALVRLQATASANTAVGEFGVWMRVQDTWMSIQHGDLGGLNLFNAYAWWQPNQMFRLTMGTFPDGWWDMAGTTTRWGFYGMALDAEVGVGFGLGEYQTGAYNVNFTQAFFPSTAYGLLLSLAPTRMITLNFGLPVRWWGPPAEIGDLFSESLMQLVLNLDFGRIGLTYRANPLDDHSGNLWAYLHLSAIDNLQLDLGAGFDLADDPLIGVGLGLRYTFSPEFDLTVRTMAKIDTVEDSPFQMLFEARPSYQIRPGITAFLGAGIAFTGEGGPTVNNEATFGWHINPYVRFGSTWGPSFYAGLEIKNWNGDRGHTEWRVPLAVYMFF